MATIPRTARFAARTSRMRASTIREMLKVTQQPDVISFGGGLPAPELFPTDEIADCTRQVMEEHGAKALQYSVTDGIAELRYWVAERLTARLGGVQFIPENVMIVNGSQQGLDLIAKILLDPGDHVVLENPSYLGAIQAFDAYQARYLAVDTDDDGMVPESLDRVLAHAEPLPKFVYVVPNFQNPTGRTLAFDRRERIVRICEHYGVPIVEDDPYGELRFEGRHLPALSSFKQSGTVIYCGTGSKIVAPGMRVAWIATHDHEVREKLVLAKQGADLQSGTLAQYIFTHFVGQREAFARHVESIIRVYGHRRDVMLEALEEYMPDGVSFSRPQGGMFLWATVDGVDTTELLKVSAEQKVVFVPGVSFYPQHDVTNGMRLNFSNAGDEKIRRGIERLANAVRTFR
ncbi:MAG: aminotransferase-like domain-containing protein [Vulcanimicrobiaceae bacterium]